MKQEEVLKLIGDSAKVIKLGPVQHNYRNFTWASPVQEGDLFKYEQGLQTRLDISVYTYVKIGTALRRDQIIQNAMLPHADVELEPIAAAEWEKQYSTIVQTQLNAGVFPYLGTGIGLNVGSDPEIFVVDKNDTVIPAWKFLPSLNDRSHKLAPFWDGFQAEFNLVPDTCHVSIVGQIRRQLTDLLREAQKHDAKARLTSASVVEVPQALMKEANDTQAGLGCSPSLNVYGVEPLKIEKPRLLPVRFAGFHIHYGMDTKNQAVLFEQIKSIDRILGPISISLLEGVEDPRRRQFYGKAGEYRLPRHGLEYRTMASSVMCHPIVTHLILDIARFALTLPLSKYKDLWQISDDTRVQRIINDYDVDEARKVLQENKTALKNICKSLYAKEAGRGSNQSNESLVEQMILEGCRNFLPINEIAETWALTNKNNVWRNYQVGVMKTELQNT